MMHWNFGQFYLFLSFQASTFLAIYKPAFDEDFEDTNNLPKFDNTVKNLQSEELFHISLQKEDSVLEEIKEELVEELEKGRNGKNLTRIDLKYIREEIELESRLEDELVHELNGPGHVSSAVEVEVEEERIRHSKDIGVPVERRTTKTNIQVKNEM